MATKLPGTFIMRAVVRDNASQRIGSASQVVQVPDTRKGQLAMTGVLLRLATPELLAKAGTSNPAPVPDGKVEEWNEGGPAVRRFLAGQSIAYGYTVINARLRGSAKQPKLSLQTKLYRNGKLIFTGNPSHEVFPSAANPADFFGGGVLNLGKGIPAGEYVLQVTVTDELAPRKKSQFSQWMDFEVVARPPSRTDTPSRPEKPV
jgi:hypothetical protein